ncbi:MAG: DMT family transporter [Lactobacillaceae bacterium]|jgi:transporter family-2 protein|nr:DMT family transporter [Lactobacillaceae bacterium]
MIVLGLFAGLMLAAQNPINAKFSALVKSPLVASLFGYVIGVAILGVIVLVTGGGLLENIEAAMQTNMPVWFWLGGLCGAIYITAIIILFPKIGAVETVMLPTLGMIFSSIVIESFGWLEVTAIPLTVTRMLGLLILVGGMVIAVVVPTLNQRPMLQKAAPVVNGRLAWRIFGFIAGVATTLQTTLNGHLGVVLHSTYQATLIAFIVGLAVVASVMLVRERHAFRLVLPAAKYWWGWVGGALGSFYVLFMTIMIPVLGPGLTVALPIIGVMFGSLFVQKFGLFGSIKAAVHIAQIIGVILMVGGILIIKLI